MSSFQRIPLDVHVLVYSVIARYTSLSQQDEAIMTECHMRPATMISSLKKSVQTSTKQKINLPNTDQQRDIDYCHRAE